MLMRGLQTTAIWTAGLSALTGAGLLAVFLSSPNPNPHALTAAAIAAAIGVVSLLISVVIVDVLAGRRFESGMDSAQAGSPDVESARGEAARFQERLQMLDRRLDIDEPRLCSQHMIRCTCWSLCGGLPGENSAAAGTASSREQPQCGDESETKALPLQIIFRQGRDDCQFRFESPLGRPMSQAEK